MFYLDGCSAGVLSQALNSNPAIRACCDAHDVALAQSFDPLVFMRENELFRICLEQATNNPAIGWLGWAAVSSVVGWLMFKFGKKMRKA